MKCPKCRSEVAGQSVCPYCGAAVYTKGSDCDYSRTAMHDGDSEVEQLREINRHLHKLETWLDLALVLQTAMFVLIVLILAVLALK